MANPEIRVRHQRTSDSSSPPSSSGGSSPAYACAVARGARGSAFARGRVSVRRESWELRELAESRAFEGISREIARTYVFIRHDLVCGGGISLRSGRAGHFDGRVRLVRADAPRDRLWLPPSGIRSIVGTRVRLFRVFATRKPPDWHDLSNCITLQTSKKVDARVRRSIRGRVNHSRLGRLSSVHTSMTSSASTSTGSRRSVSGSASALPPSPVR